ncbi:MAG: dipeptide epimerase [Haloarculaceae archaeon]
MNVAVEGLTLHPADPFGIARGTSETVRAVLVEISHEGSTGIGAATPSAYYGETAASVRATLDTLVGIVEDIDDPHAGQHVAQRMADLAPDAPAARSAVSTALADLAARDLGVPIYRQWGLDPARTPRTSYTVGLDTPDRMAEKAVAAREAGYPILKVKLGADDGGDRERFAAVREAAPDATIRVDANGGWSADRAIRAADWLADGGVEFLEQPVPGDDLDGLRRVHEATALPVCADEACVDAPDVARVAEACDLVTVKLTKCGGLRPAVRQIHAADAHGLDVLLGCMLESNAAIAPACHLAPLVEYADLDGALLLADDPIAGVPMPEGRIDLSAVDAGSGARRR